MTELNELDYPVVVADRVASHVAAFVRSKGYRRTIVVCDKNVVSRAREVARTIGRSTVVLSFRLGERRKTFGTVRQVLEELAAAKADRETLLIGVGGGVAGDLFGLAAALYMRGIAFVNVATSLVAMVDAAIGGKTGVDLAAGKNLAGVFRDPKAVFCDVAALATLSERQLREGLAELVKHGIIEGGEAFDSLETLAPHPLRKWPWEVVVADSLRVKAMVVADDRVEAGTRAVLNLGHTFAHAIEQSTGYRTTHGQAVAIGLRLAGMLALRTGRFSGTEHMRVLSLLALLRLPMNLPSDDVEPVLQAMESDKKRRDGRLRFVLPRAIGDVEYGITVPARSVRAVLVRGRSSPGVAEFR